MCLFESFFTGKQHHFDNQYIIDFLKHCSKFSENTLDDEILGVIESMLKKAT